MRSGKGIDLEFGEHDQNFKVSASEVPAEKTGKSSDCPLQRTLSRISNHAFEGRIAGAKKVTDSLSISLKTK